MSVRLPAPVDAAVGAIDDVLHHERFGRPLRMALAGLIGLGLLNLLPGTQPLGVLIYGAVIGSLYGLIAIGLILVYRANRVVNFAQAGLGAVPAVVGMLLITNFDVPYLVSLGLVILSCVILGAFVEVVIMRRFSKAPRLIVAVATIGLSQLLAYLEFNTPGWISGSVLPPNEFPTPFSGNQFNLFGTIFDGDHIVTVVVVALLGVGLGAFLRFTRIGIAVRASADNGERASLLGIPVRRVSTIVWAIAALLSGMGIFLRAPLVGLPLGTISSPSILLYALAAAVLARMESLPTALIAGTAVGAVDITIFYSTRDSVLSAAAMLPIILVALLLQKDRRSRVDDAAASTWRNVQEPRPVPAELRGVREVVIARWVLLAGSVALGLGLPFLVGDLYRNDISLLVIYAIVGVSLVVLTGWGGQISLGHFAFVGVGAAVAGGLAANHGVDFFVTVICAGIVGALVAILIGLPAVRLQGLFLAVTTLAFAAATRSFLLNRQYFQWLLPQPGAQIHRPRLYGRIDTANDLAFYYLCLAFLVLAVLSARSLRQSRTGRVLIAARDNPRAGQAYGVNLARTRLAAFALSGFLAAVAGSLFAYQQGAVDSGAFPAYASLQLFATTVVGGLTSIAGGVVGAAYVIALRRLPIFQGIELIELLATGVGLIILLLFFPGGFAEMGYRQRDRFLRWVAARHGIHVPSLVADSLVSDDDPDAADVHAIADAELHGHGEPEDVAERLAAIAAAPGVPTGASK